MKVIFLDHDGVITLDTEFGGRFRKIKKWNKLFPERSIKFINHLNTIDIEYRFDNFNKKAVSVLNDILLKTDAEIVVSSDWRNECTLVEMQELYKLYGVVKSPIDYTPKLEYINEFGKRDYELERTLEIKQWLSSNEVDKWVVIDDLNLPELDFFVRTKRVSEGIKQNGVKEKILNILQ